MSERQRISQLRERNMDIPKDRNKERNILKRYNYYNLVNGYKDPFLVDENDLPRDYPLDQDYYLDGTTPSSLEKLMEFDKNLRNIFLRQILDIEDNLKNSLVQSFYNYHTKQSVRIKKTLHRESEYLRRDYYDLNTSKTKCIKEKSGFVYTYVEGMSNEVSLPRRNDHFYSVGNWHSVRKRKNYETFVSNVYKTIGQQSGKNSSIDNYLEKHKYLPMWVLMNILTFGNLSYFYSFQKAEVQTDFIKNIDAFRGRNIDTRERIEFENVLKILSIFRNLCAHNERMYCTKVKIPIGDNFMYFGKHLPFNEETQECHIHKRCLNERKSIKRKNARNSIYSCMFAVSLFLSNSEFKKFKNSIKKEFDNLEKAISDDSYENVKNLMGMNFNWYDLL